MQLATEEDKCLKCGRCCYFIVGDRIERCKYLLDDNTCEFYENRFDLELFSHPPVTCHKRLESKWDYKGCPYNTGKPLFPTDAEVKKKFEEEQT